jgi:hypothetical protein
MCHQSNRQQTAANPVARRCCRRSIHPAVRFCANNAATFNRGVPCAELRPLARATPASRWRCLRIGLHVCRRPASRGQTGVGVTRLRSVICAVKFALVAYDVMSALPVACTASLRRSMLRSRVYHPCRVPPLASACCPHQSGSTCVIPMESRSALRLPS